jgi:hypothetical protein
MAVVTFRPGNALGDTRQQVGPIEAVAHKQSDPALSNVHNKAVTVELDLGEPVSGFGGINNKLAMLWCLRGR